MSSISVEDYKKLIEHFDKLYEINKQMPMFYYIENIDMIIFKIKNYMIESCAEMQNDTLNMNFYDIVYELKQNIIDNVKRIDSMCKYKIEVPIDDFYNFDNNYINRKNYSDMIIEAKKIINIVIKNHRRTEIPYQLTDDYAL
jgi:hypothetical protein